MSSRFTKGSPTQIWGWSFVLLTTLFLSPVAAAAVHRALSDNAIVLILPEEGFQEATRKDHLETLQKKSLATSQDDATNASDTPSKVMVAVLALKRVALDAPISSIILVPIPAQTTLLLQDALQYNAPSRAPPV